MLLCRFVRPRPFPSLVHLYLADDDSAFSVSRFLFSSLLRLLLVSLGLARVMYIFELQGICTFLLLTLALASYHLLLPSLYFYLAFCGYFSRLWKELESSFGWIYTDVRFIQQIYYWLFFLYFWVYSIYTSVLKMDSPRKKIPGKKVPGKETLNKGHLAKNLQINGLRENRSPEKRSPSKKSPEKGRRETDPGKKVSWTKGSREKRSQ